MMAEKGLSQLAVWQKSVAFAVNICKNLLPTFPAEEKFALVSQLRRAVQSIPANIGEGHGRYYYQDSIRFLFIARGSLEETRTYLELAKNLDYLSEETYKLYIKDLEEIRMMINGYISFLKRTKQGSHDPGSSIHEDSGNYEIESDLMNQTDPEWNNSSVSNEYENH